MTLLEGRTTILERIIVMFPFFVLVFGMVFYTCKKYHMRIRPLAVTRDIFLISVFLSLIVGIGEYLLLGEAHLTKNHYGQFVFNGIMCVFTNFLIAVMTMLASVPVFQLALLAELDSGETHKLLNPFRNWFSFDKRVTGLSEKAQE